MRLKSLPDDYVRLVIKAKGTTSSMTVSYPFLELDVPPRAIVVFGPQGLELVPRR